MGIAAVAVVMLATSILVRGDGRFAIGKIKIYKSGYSGMYQLRLLLRISGDHNRVYKIPLETAND